MLKKTLIFSFITVLTVPAVPPPTTFDKVNVPEESLSIIKKQTDSIPAQTKVDKNNPQSQKVRRIDKLPPISVSAPMPEDGVFGTHKVVFIMVEFADRKFPADKNRAYYQNMIFGKNGKSMRTFYQQNSYGKFDIEGDVYGVYTINEPVQNYHYQPGQSFGLENMKKLIQKILDQTKTKVAYKGFDNFNQNGDKKSDGIIDHFGIIYPGSYGDIWPHRWGGMTMGTVQGLQVQGYFIQNTDSLMGTFAHEFGHDLGLPDLYDTDYSSYGIGKWCTMAFGSWGDGGRTPIQMSAWAKIKMGWLTPVVVSESMKNVKIPTASKQPFALKIPIGSVASKEYFLVENRQKEGYDEFLPDTGVLIWHIDESRVSNSDESFKLVDVMEAAPSRDLDGKFNVHQPSYTHTFFQGGKTDFNQTTDPGSRSYSGADTGISISVTSPSGGVMTADINRPKIPNPKGRISTLDYDNYKNGPFWYFNYGPYMEEAFVTFTPPKGGATVFSLSAGFYFLGSGDNDNAVHFRIYEDNGGKPGKVLYESGPIVPEVNEQTKFVMVNHSLSDAEGLKLPGNFIIGVASGGNTLGVICTRPGSKHSSFKMNGALQPRDDYNYVIRAVAVTDNRVPVILATDKDKVVKDMLKADKLADQKKYPAAFKLYISVLKAMEKDMYRYQEWIAPATNSLGVLAYRMKKYNEAIKAFSLALQIAEYAKAEKQQGFLQENLGETYFHLNQFDKAKEHIAKAMELKKQASVDDEFMVDSLVWYGKTLKKLGEAEEAHNYLQQGLDMATRLKDQEHIDLAKADL